MGSTKNRTAQLTAPDHPLLREFQEEVWREVLQNVPVWRWHGIAPDSLHRDAQVVARLTDAEQSPLLVARAYGEGKALFLTSTLASVYKPDRWNLLDDPQVALPLLFGIV